MIYVFGNSHERVTIKDLGDVIYYRQKKQYSEQEFQKSRDLQREIEQGRIIKLDQQPEIRNSIPENLDSPVPAGPGQGSNFDIHDIRKVVTEAISEYKSNNTDTRDALMGLIPLITETVRQEISKIPAQVQIASSGTQVSGPKAFVGPEYIPDVSISHMKSNIVIESQNVSGDGVSNSLNLLKKLNKST